MKKIAVTVIILSLLVSCGVHYKTPDTHVEDVVKMVVNTKSKIEKQQAKSNDTVFLAFWDFDKTILSGDCSEGLKRDGQEVFKGLVEMSIDNGFSKIHPKGDIKGFFKEYERLEKEVDTLTSYTYLPKIFAGADKEEVLAFSKNHFNTVLKPYLFDSSIQMMQKLNDAGIESYVISASPAFFVKGASDVVSMPQDHIFGIEMETVNGKLTDTLIQPVTFAEGKTQQIQIIVDKIRYETGKNVIVLAGFGDSYKTDGDFLYWIATQKLPVGKPVSVKINSKKNDCPKKYKNLFIEVKQKKTVLETLSK